MKAKALRIVFMGTPEFAVPSLQQLNDSHHEVCAVVTTPDKQAGRGQKLRQSAVKAFAIQHHIPVEQPFKLRDQEFLDQLKSYNADLFVVIAFRMLPEIVWSMPKLGTINLHASLLPQYRGAAPINWAIINGEKKSGLSTFFINDKIDEGAIIDAKELEIGADENASSLHDRMMASGADLILDTVQAIANHDVEVKSQDKEDEGKLKNAPKIFKKDCLIDWEKDAISIHNHIRGLSYYPGAYTHIQIGDKLKVLKIFKASYDADIDEKSEAEWRTDGKTYLKFKCKNGIIDCLEVQLEGKKRMNIVDFLNGTHL